MYDLDTEIEKLADKYLEALDGIDREVDRKEWVEEARLVFGEHQQGVGLTADDFYIRCSYIQHGISVEAQVKISGLIKTWGQRYYSQATRMELEPTEPVGIVWINYRV